MASRFPEWNVSAQRPDGVTSVPPPALGVSLVSMTQTQLLGGYASRVLAFELHYAAASEGEAAVYEMHDAAERLYEQLERIEIGGAVYRSSNLKHELKDGRMLFGLTLTVRVKRLGPETAKMGMLEQEAGTK